MGAICSLFSSPKAPDPYATAQAQAGANKQSVQDAAAVNQINQVTPYGSQTWSGTIGQPDRTVTTSVSPEAQAYIDSQVGYSQDSANAAKAKIGQIDQTPFSLSGMPDVRAAGPSAPLATSYQSGGSLTSSVQPGTITNSIADAGQVQRSLAPSGPIQTSVGGADAATRNSVEDALYKRATARLDPQFETSDRQMETKLANQGITQGSDAYTRAQADYGRNKNDAYSSAANDAILAGGQEQSRLFGLGLQQGQFANSAQAQQEGQNLDAGNFSNAGQAQTYGQNANNATFANAAQGQQFGQGVQNAQLSNTAAVAQDARNQAAAQFTNDAAAQKFQQDQALQSSDMALRNQGVSEYLMGRNQPINEAAAISGQSPGVQTPNFAAPSQYSPQGVPVGDYINQNYQSQVSQRNALIGALGNVAGAAGSAAIMCWVAREVYGSTNPRWLKMRTWMLSKAPPSLREFYLKHGPAIAEFIRDKPEWKDRIHAAMEECLV